MTAVASWQGWGAVGPMNSALSENLVQNISLRNAKLGAKTSIFKTRNLSKAHETRESL